MNKRSGEVPLTAIITKLREGNLREQIAAVRRLGAMGRIAVGAVPDLVRLLDSENIQARLFVPASLRSIGVQSVPFLVETVKTTKSARLRENCLWALSQMGTLANSAIPLLANFISHPTFPQRKNAIAAMGYIGKGAGAVHPVLVAILQGKESMLQVAAAKSALAMDSECKIAEGILCDALRSKVSHMQRAAAGSLSGIQSPTKLLISALDGVLRSADAQARASAAYSLIVFRKKLRKSMQTAITLLRSKQLNTRQDALIALSHLPMQWKRIAFKTARLSCYADVRDWALFEMQGWGGWPGTAK